VTPADPRLDRLTREILHYEDLAIEHAEHAVKFKAEIGTRLIAAKDLLPHGQFMNWAKERFGWDHSHVNRHMTLSRNWERVRTLPADASLRMALSAIAESKAAGEVSASRPGHPRFALILASGEEAVVELRTGDVEQLCATFDARALEFRKVEKAA
jgi:hypothetical protein